MKLITSLLLTFLVASCVAPPKVVNDPTIPDNGVIILNIPTGDAYQREPYCGFPYSRGSYCDPYNSMRSPRMPATQFYLYPPKAVDKQP